MRYYGGETHYFFDWLPDSPIIAPLPSPSQLVAVASSSQDNGVKLRIYGWDTNGKRIFTDGQDGFVVAANTVATPAAPVVARIERVSKDESKGYITLSVWANGAVGTKLGDYEPDETEPMYRQLRVNRKCASLRIAFRKRSRLITQLSDVIPLRSKAAIVSAVAALACRLTDPNRYNTLMGQAISMVADEQKQRDQNMPPKPPEHLGQQDLVQDHGGFY